MEFIQSNLINTSTMLSVTSGTLSASNILGRNKTIQYVSDAFNNDLTTSSIVVTFDATTPISRIAILGCNWKDFTIFANGATASTLSLNSPTTTSDWSSNSESSMYLSFTTIQATSIHFDVLATQVANSEKAVGHIYTADNLLTFDRIPSAKNYKPSIVPRQILHQISDGGTRLHTVDEKFKTSIKIQNISTAFRNQLKTVYDLRSSFGFVAFETATAWDEVFFEAVWVGSFNSFQYSDDAAAAGFNLDMDLRETTRK